MELLAHKDFKATLEKPESPDHPAQWVLVVPRVPQENQERMGKQANLGKLGNVDLLGLRELVDSQEHRVYLESRDTEVIQVLMVLKESLEPLGLKVRPGLLEKVALLDQWAHVVYLVNGGVLDHPELLVLVGMMARPALLVLRVQSVRLALPVSQDPPVLRVKQDLPEPEDPREHKDPAESLASPDLQDLLESLVTPGLMASPEPKDQWVLLVSLVLLVSQALGGLLALRERLDLWGPRDSLVIRVSQGSRVKLVLKEKLATLGLKVPLALLERKVSEDPEESRVLLDPSGRPEREELLVIEVFLDKMVWLVQRVLRASGELRECRGPREPAEIRAGLENRVCLVHGV